jgi:hypothetical protein
LWGAYSTEKWKVSPIVWPSERKRVDVWWTT